jgi:hypothetical protein
MKIESRCLAAFVNSTLGRKSGIMKRTSSVVCLVIVVGFSLSSLLRHRHPLHPILEARLTRADEGDLPKFGLKSEDGPGCSGAPNFDKGLTFSPVPVLKMPATHIPVPEKDRKQAVLSLIHYPWQDLDYNIVFMGSRLGYRAMTLTARHRIEVYVRPGESLMRQAFDLAHELGHAFDLKYNNNERRRKWCELRGIKPSIPWFGCDACPDYGTPAGDFAETFASLLLGSGQFHGIIAPLPRRDQVPELAAFCKINQISDTWTVCALKGKTGPTAIQSAKAEKQVVNEDKAEASSKADAGSANIEAPRGAGKPSEATDQVVTKPVGHQNTGPEPDPATILN